MVRLRRSSARRSAWVLKTSEYPSGAGSAAADRASSVMVGDHRGRLRAGDRTFPDGGSQNDPGADRTSHLLLKRLNNGCGAGWRVRTTFLGAVRSPWGLSLSRLVGFGIWFPPTHVGARDHRPTAVSAPRLVRLMTLFGSAAALELERRRAEGAPASRRPRPAGSNRACRSRRFQPPPRRGGTAARASLASSHCFGLLSIARRAGHAPAFDRACRRIRDRLAGGQSAGIAASLSPLAAGGADARRSDVNPRAVRGSARRSSGSVVRATRLLRPGRPPHRLRRRLLRPEPGPIARAKASTGSRGRLWGMRSRRGAV